MTTDIPQDVPRIAVVVPIFRHSVLLADAVQSILDQNADFGIHLVLVNDGCPHAETEETCRDYALSDPDRFSYLRKPNGGLSDARNHGIQYALEALPSVEAIYMLDADNMLRPSALARAMAELDAHPEADWIYPNIDMIGMEFAGDYGGDYSLLVHTGMNICEAGSLIRRRVFEAGVLFDTSFKLGFEDWDFFMSAGKAGFRGRNLENFGFQYRKRPESMLADSTRDTATIRGEMRIKHKKLLEPENLLKLEQEECPRYAIYLPDENEVLLAVDPMAQGTRRISVREFEQMVWRHQLSPTRHFVPPLIAVMRSDMMQGLQKANVLRWALWKLEWMTERTGISTLSLDVNTEDRFGFTEHDSADGLQTEASVLMIQRKIALEVLRDQNTHWINTLVVPGCQPSVSAIELRVPAEIIDAEVAASTAVASFDFLSLINQLHVSSFRESVYGKWEWRVGDIAMRPDAHELVRESFNGAPAYPRLQDGRRHVGMILPIVEFGGVEKVALNMARGLQAHGWVPHLFVVASNEGSISGDWLDVFESVNFLSDRDFDIWGGATNTYYGTNVPQWAMGGNHGSALGLMSWLDAVVNCHGAAINGVIGQLKRFGVKTVNSLHLNELSPFGRPLGNTYLGVAYEHAYDLFVPCSNQLGDWCHAMGVPSQKVLPIPNAPSFDADADRLAIEQAARAQRDPNAPLRVIYLGRLDRQKGLDKLSECVSESRRREMPVEWRIVGKAIVAEDIPPIAPQILELLEPPLKPGDEMLGAFAWADVMVLLSSFEGLPLTILEAMRSGVVTIATDVGAVSDALRDNENGILVDLETATRDCMTALGTLSEDRALLRRLSDQAYADMQGRNWITATAPLHAHLQELIEKAARAEARAAAKAASA